MKVRDLMTSPAIRICEDEPVTVAARTLERYHIGVLPVCDCNGNLRGIVTDRDLVIRCMASDRKRESTLVGEIMTGRVTTVDPEMELREAAKLMGQQQVRRLPVVEQGKLCGMISLGDLANGWERNGAEAVLCQITNPLSAKNDF